MWDMDRTCPWLPPLLLYAVCAVIKQKEAHIVCIELSCRTCLFSSGNWGYYEYQTCIIVGLIKIQYFKTCFCLKFSSLPVFFLIYHGACSLSVNPCWNYTLNISGNFVPNNSAPWAHSLSPIPSYCRKGGTINASSEYRGIKIMLIWKSDGSV